MQSYQNQLIRMHHPCSSLIRIATRSIINNLKLVHCIMSRSKQPCEYCYGYVDIINPRHVPMEWFTRPLTHCVNDNAFVAVSNANTTNAKNELNLFLRSARIQRGWRKCDTVGHAKFVIGSGEWWIPGADHHAPPHFVEWWWGHFQKP